MASAVSEISTCSPSALSTCGQLRCSHFTRATLAPRTSPSSGSETPCHAMVPSGAGVAARGSRSNAFAQQRARALEVGAEWPIVVEHRHVRAERALHRLCATTHLVDAQ